MSLDLIRANLLLDTVSTTAADILTSPMNQDAQWTTAGQVPTFLYTSLTAMCSAYGSLSTLICSDYGVAEIPSGVSIVIQGHSRPANLGDFIEEDAVGATYMDVEILVKQPKSVRNEDFTRDVALRIVYILDTYIRGDSTNQFSNAQSAGPSLFITGDNTVYPGTDAKMEWDGSGILRASQQLIRFSYSYTSFFVPLFTNVGFS